MDDSEPLLRTGDRVMIDCIEGFGGSAHIIAVCPGSPTSKYRVLMDNGGQPPFWAHDFEVTPLIDSRIDTYKHIQVVQQFMGRVIAGLLHRSAVHDQSKLASPEVEVFDEFTPKLAASSYGSDQYKSYLAAMKPALDHHYAVNSHHPEFHALGGNGVDVDPKLLANGEAIRCMSLLDILEMLCDWKAATLRHNDGDIRRSIEVNQKRFGYSDELKQILLNTLSEIESPTEHQ